MKEKDFKEISKKVKYYITHKKQQTALIITSLIFVVCVIVLGVMKLTAGEVVAAAKERNTSIKGATITDMVYNMSEEVAKGPTKSYGKVVYLTIDDGPSEYTDKIIKILNDNNVKATFFMINGNMEAFPNQVKNIVSSGNTPGFHSVSHDIHKLYKTATSAKEEFDVNQKTFNKITGKTSKVIRLPFGSKPYTPKSTYNSLMDAGYKLWDWTLDTEDWRSTSPQIIETVKKHSSDTDNVVLLMHERKQTVAVIDEMIKYFKKEGFEFAQVKQTDEARNYWNQKLFN